MHVVEIIGDTGSGKSELMFALAERLESKERNIYWIYEKITEQVLFDIDSMRLPTIFMDSISKETFDENIEILNIHFGNRLGYIYGAYRRE